jgi:hypothetical protein
MYIKLVIKTNLYYDARSEKHQSSNYKHALVITTFHVKYYQQLKRHNKKHSLRLVGPIIIYLHIAAQKY